MSKRHALCVPLLLISLAWIAGCTPEDNTPKASLFEDDHAVAAHWPDGLSDVAAKLRDRLSVTEPDAQFFEEIKDLVSWTSEVAADTNLAEEDWLPLYHASESLSSNLRGTNQTLSENNRQQIESLCKLIDTAVPKIPNQLARLKVN